MKTIQAIKIGNNSKAKQSRKVGANDTVDCKAEKER